MTYRERVNLLHEQKIRDTLAKKRQKGYMDLDDNGGIPIPDDFHFTPVSNSSDGGFYGATGFSVNMAKLLDAHPVYVDPIEILAGRRMVMLLDYQGGWPGKWPEHLMPYDELKEKQKKYDIISGIGSNQHYACDFDMGIKLGFPGLLAKIRKYREINGEDKYEFYDAHERVLLALMRFIQRHVDEIAYRLEVETNPEYRATLREMYDCNRNLLEREPRTMLEVCQWLGWFYHISWMYNREAAGMQLDTFLYPFYKADKEAGLIDDDKTRFIIANLFLLNSNYYQIGGPNYDGTDKTNELSFLIIEAAHWLNSATNLTIRLHDNINMDLFRRGVEYLFEDGNGWPRFSGHKGLMNYTKIREMTPEMACDRLAVGCHWMALPGREYPLNDCVKINCAKVFDVAFHEVSEFPEPTVAKLWDRFIWHLDQAIEVTAKGVNFHLDNMHKHMPELIGNLLMHNALETGTDISQCAEFFNIGVDGAGLAIVADSFAALQQRVEDEKVLTWQQVYEAVLHDFEGEPYERTRLILKNSDRYCGGNNRGDAWAQKISRTFSEKIVNYKMPNNRVMIPGWFSWANTIALGKTVGATPDGRKAGTPIMHGANPNYNFRKDGAATAMSTGIALIQPGYGNTAPFQLELDPGLKAEEGGIEKVMALLKGHVDQGGTLININIVDKDKVLAANEDPEKYPELIVRVTGFTAYFVTLSPEFRQLVVDRMLESI